MKTYGIEIYDYRKDTVRETRLDGWATAEAASDAAWTLIDALCATTDNLDCENQGDQFLAFYKDGETDSEGKDIGGFGAVVFKVTNPDGSYYEDL